MSDAGRRRGPVRWVRRALGVALIGAIVVIADPAALWSRLAGVAPGWLALAVGIAVAANVCAVARWWGIGRGMGLSMRPLGSAITYFKSVAVNTVAPGGTLGGDVLRAVEIRRDGNDAAASATSVALDRLLGLWAQAVVSMGALAWALARGTASSGPLVATGYVGGLALLIALPWMPLAAGRLAPACLQSARPAATRLFGTDRVTRWTMRLGALVDPVVTALADARAFVRTQPRRAGGVLALALVVAGCMSATLWSCLHAVGLDVSLLDTTAAAAGLFFAGCLPVAVGGFGPREAAAIGILGALAVPAPAAVSAALLYGLTATVQGLVAAPLFLADARSR